MQLASLQYHLKVRSVTELDLDRYIQITVTDLGVWMLELGEPGPRPWHPDHTTCVGAFDVGAWRSWARFLSAHFSGRLTAAGVYGCDQSPDRLLRPAALSH